MNSSLSLLRKEIRLKKDFKGRYLYRIYFQKDALLKRTLNFLNKDIKKQRMDFKNDFVFVISLRADSIDQAFSKMQRESWNKKGIADVLINHLGLTHYSMTIGDIIVNENGKQWRANHFGWHLINPKSIWRTKNGRSKKKRNI